MYSSVGQMQRLFPVWIRFWVLAGVVAVILIGRPTGLIGRVNSEPPAKLATEYADRIRPLLNQYCVSCHGNQDAEADLDLDRFANLADVRKATKIWQKVGEMLDGGQMPPAKSKQPTEEERTALRSWVRSFLKDEAKSRAGDPGRVLLRRLSHAEYTYTIRDLTGVDSLDPAKEFPIDGAGGEGFTNTGDSLAMSPALLNKYLDAAKGIAAHAVPLPDGIRFSPHVTRQDWTNEILDRIRTKYQQYSDPGGSKVALQGLIWDGKEGGRLPVEKYVAATLAERDNIHAGRKTLSAIATERHLSEKYLTALWQMFVANDSSPLLDDLRSRWQKTKPENSAELVAEITRWQNAVWKFNSVGHIGKLNGPKSWLEPVDPLVGRQELRWKAPPTDDADFTLYLSAADCSGAESPSFVEFQQPRFVASGRPDLFLRDVRAVSQARMAQRDRIFGATTKYLQAAHDADAANGPVDVPALAPRYDLDPIALSNWLNVLNIGTNGPVKLSGHFATKLQNVGGHSFVTGWGSPDLPSVLANSSDTLVRIPGDQKGHGVTVHPSPTQAAVVGWQSPIAATVRVQAKVQHVHTGCGNGVTWAIDVRRGATRQRVTSGIAHGAKPPTIAPLDNVKVAVGDVILVAIGARNGDHSCDLTAVDLTITADGKNWDLAKDISNDILASNPHRDSHNNENVWHFYGEAESANRNNTIPDGSLLSQWRAACTAAERDKLAAEVQRLLTSPPPSDKKAPDAVLRRNLSALGGPLFNNLSATDSTTSTQSSWGVDLALFGRHPDVPSNIDAASLCVKTPAVVEIRLPADLVAGYEFVTTGTIHADSRERGCVQLRVSTAKPVLQKSLDPGLPILVAEGSPARKRIAAGLDAFRELFPTAVCYSKIVPVDEVVTLTLYHREDQHLSRLMLTDAERRQLDRWWDELHYVSHSALVQVDAYRQLMEYATQDGDPKLFEPLREPTMAAAAAFRQRMTATEPKHLEAVLQFADRAYRRPLSGAEKNELTSLYRSFRQQEMSHDESIRLTLARVFVAPAFLYRLEKPGPGAAAVPVTDFELANRLSYFLWSSLPDAELRATAAAGKLRDPDVLVAQMHRMRQDDRVRRLAIEFGCQWLQVRGFDAMNEKSERHFPTFAGMRSAIYEETVLFLTDFFRDDRTVASLLDGDATYLNEQLANHYGIPGVSGSQWRRVEGVRQFGRGGILALAATMATQSGASRTSPILRGNWISEVLLGEKLPRPPKGVPQLPDDEGATDGKTVRELVERHSSDPKCAVCHKKIDAYGFALETFDPIGRKRDKDLAGRPIDTRARTADGAELDGLDGLRHYLLTKRKDAIERQFCRKLLGYALGRAVQLSDEPLLDDMQSALAKHGGHVSAILETIVRSRQFREIRGSQHPSED